MENLQERNAKRNKHIECVVIEGSESYGELARKECKKERTDANIGVEENNQIDNNITFNARTLKESKKFESRLTTTTLHEIRTFTSDVSESNISVISIKSATKKGEKKYFQYADDEIGHEAKALGVTKNDRLAVVQSDRNNDETNQIGRHNFDDHKHKKHVQDTSLHSKINEIKQENQMENTKFHNQTRRIDSKFREIDLQKSPYQNHQSSSVNQLREDYRPHNRRRNVYDEIVHGPPSYGRRSNNTSNRFGRDDFGDFNRNPSVKGNFPPSFQNEPSRRFSNPFLPTTEGQSFNPAVPNRGYVYPGLYARAPPGVREGTSHQVFKMNHPEGSAILFYQQLRANLLIQRFPTGGTFTPGCTREPLRGLRGRRLVLKSGELEFES
ncbi:uncharacterized protein LOC103519575 [Diaphorina citri]|uniref:Uncharacterized protein LOC103519575 n=1 Tax=Diaphorina citri TaxID=121845 RepID=A0A1S3DJ10_DIACI|nr:uncharacterized protein LOC103519575 [Diaphorina citri]